MEKTPPDKLPQINRQPTDPTGKPINGSGPAPDVTWAFSLPDPATGKMRQVRKMTDQEIERWIPNVAAEAQQHLGNVLADIEKYVRCKSFECILQYERNRRINEKLPAAPIVT
jgi:hypothetical protein